jgi:hypothetical protein
MLIDQVYQLVLYIINKEQRGDLPPSKFNVIAKAAQLEFMSRRIGNIQMINQRGVPQYGYESTWRIHEDLRPMIYGPMTIPINNEGNFPYPYGYIWPDAVRKTNERDIKRITEDQYANIKWSPITPPTSDYPVVIFRNPYGFIDPYSIGSFKMSFLKNPPDPIWGYTGTTFPVFNSATSVDFLVPVTCFTELVMIVCQHAGINLGAMDVTQYASLKQQQGT